MEGQKTSLSRPEDAAVRLEAREGQGRVGQDIIVRAGGGHWSMAGGQRGLRTGRARRHWCQGRRMLQWG